MARPSKTGGKRSAAKTRKAGSMGGRKKPIKTKRHISPAYTSSKRFPISDVTKELQEAREQQAATAEILKVIASSPSDVQPVFEAIARSANRLIGGFSTAVYRVIKDVVYLVAFTPTDPEADEALKAIFPLHRNQVPSLTMVQNGRTAQIADAEAADEQSRRIAHARGWRSATFTPLMNDGAFIGFIACTRREVGVLADHHVQLLRTFADQAVIAIENAHLFDEAKARTEDLRQSLEYQTATSDVLSIISRSPTNVQPVFEAIAASALRLCGAKWSVVTRFDGTQLHLAALHNLSDPEGVDAIRKIFPRPLSRGGPTDRSILTGTVVNLPDVLKDPEYIYQSISNSAGYRSHLAVPMSRNGNAVGAITVAGQYTAAFTERHVNLLKAFADQAVIAIENTRLFNETQEALEQQKASSDILRVISSSVADAQPVFDKILDSCKHLFGSDETAVLLLDGEDTITLAAYVGKQHDAVVASFPAPLEKSPAGRAIRERRVAHYIDVANDPQLTRTVRRVAQLAGYESMAYAPMLSSGRGIGAIGASRNKGSFSDKELTLLQTFADQAVIAIENARLFNETQQALERQTATADILRVIASSLDDVQPVFEAMLDKAMQLCQAAFGELTIYDGELFRTAAIRGLPPSYAEYRLRDPPRYGPKTVPARLLDGERRVHIVDLTRDSGLYEAGDPNRRALVDLGGARSLLSVPLLRDERVAGSIMVFRQELRPFSQRQIELLENFAAQAVIAIENARLFHEVEARTRELSEALTYQMGSANILNVIASSPTDVNPVLQAIVESACELCDAYDAIVRLKDGNHLVPSAHHGPIPTNTDKWSIERNSVTGRAVIDKKPVHVHDMQSTEGDEFPESQQRARHLGHRTILSVPLLREGESIGSIILRRTEVHPFDDKQIALLQTFADQAVIAIGNVRLFEEVQAKSRDLAESLQQQTATADVLKVISRSTFDLPAVLQALVESVARLCDADKTIITREKNGAFYRAEAYGFSSEFRQYVKETLIEVERGSTFGRALLEGRVIHVPDVLNDPEYTYFEDQRLGGYRTVLTVPMLRQDIPIGVLSLTRSQVRPFTDKQIELARTFADQAAIAIENVRLFESVEARTRELSKSLDDLRAAQDRLVQTEKLASLGQLTAGIAHEIKNPLNFVNNFSALSAELTGELNDLLKTATLTDKMRGEVEELTRLLQDNLAKIVQHGRRADSIVKNMLLHSREGSSERRSVDINALVGESLNLAYHGARAEKAGFDITLKQDLSPDAGALEIYPQEMTRALLNLISNGFYAAIKRKVEARDEAFEPVVSAATRSLGRTIEIRIRDNGIGISPEVREKMFNPFFTTKPTGEGTGLGLSMTHDIVVKQHGGRIDVETKVGEFSEFIITLPRDDRTASGEEPE
jgi:GAF domain-containing protein